MATSLILGSIFVILISPILGIFVILPNLIYRLLIGQLAKFLRPDLISLMSPQCSIWAGHHIRPTARENIGAFLVFDGVITRAQVVEAIETKIFQAQNPQHLFPELQYYYVPWMGLNFWKREKPFSLDNHVFEEAGAMSPNELPAAACKLYGQGWAEGLSPWKFMLYSNYVLESGERKSVLMVCFHHGLTDGEGIVAGFICTIFGREATITTELPTPKDGLLKRLLSVPYAVTKDTLESYDRSQIHLAEKDLSLNRQAWFSKAPIPMDLIRGIQTEHNVSMTAVFLTAIAGGLRKYMKDVQRMKIPKEVHALLPIFMPRRDPSLVRNLSTHCFLSIPVGTESPTQRLHAAEKIVCQQIESVLPKLYQISYSTLGRMTRPVQRTVLNAWQPTAMYVEEDVHMKDNRSIEFHGARLSEIRGFGGNAAGAMGIHFFMSVFQDNAFIQVQLDESLCKSQETAKNLTEDIIKELVTLAKL